MATIKRLNAICLIAAGAVILSAAGCQQNNNQPPEDHAEKIHSEEEIHATQRLEMTQTEAGARYEATLYPQHFDGPGLSSLGTILLDEMLADSHSLNPIVVYLAIPSDRWAQDRHVAVARYLEDRGGLKPEQIQLQDGPNPATYAPVEPNIKNYDKTDTANGDAGSAAGASGSSSSH